MGLVKKEHKYTPNPMPSATEAARATLATFFQDEPVLITPARSTRLLGLTDAADGLVS